MVCEAYAFNQEPISTNSMSLLLFVLASLFRPIRVKAPMNGVFYRLVAHDGKKRDENKALQYGNISAQIAARDGWR